VAKQDERKTCTVYMTPDERQLLAKVASGHGVGLDYLSLLALGHKALRGVKRALPRWLARRVPRQPPPSSGRKARPKPRAAPQERHCRTCTNVSPVQTSRDDPLGHPDSATGRLYLCTAGVWTQPMREQSLRNSRRLRTLSLTCPHYSPAPRASPVVPHHCRACRELVATATPDQRYVCGRGMWTNPMKPHSVANSRRLARLSAACPHFAATAGRWLPRS